MQLHELVCISGHFSINKILFVSFFYLNIMEKSNCGPSIMSRMVTVNILFCALQKIPKNNKIHLQRLSLLVFSSSLGCSFFWFSWVAFSLSLEGESHAPSIFFGAWSS